MMKMYALPHDMSLFFHASMYDISTIIVQAFGHLDRCSECTFQSLPALEDLRCCMTHMHVVNASHVPLPTWGANITG